MLGWTSQPRSRYSNIQTSRPGLRGAEKVERNAVVGRQEKTDSTSIIDQLVVTGTGREAVDAIQSVQHRLDKDSTVCLMSDGMGVLEDVRKRIFAGSKSTPDFLLGHMSHKLVPNWKNGSIRELRSGQLMMAVPHMSQFLSPGLEKTETRTNFIASLREAKDLRSSMTTYDSWLKFKLPSMIFSSVVEPVCVLMGTSYQGLLQNPPARRLMQNLLSEIVTVVEHLPEVAESSAVRDFLHSRRLQKVLWGNIVGKKTAPSQLALKVKSGLPTDVDYFSGYFIRRGRELGMDLRMNTMMRDMIKAKHSQVMEELNSYIPIEETSVPTVQAFRYRTKAPARGQRRRRV